MIGNVPGMGGGLSPMNMMKNMQEKMRQKFNAADTDGNGKLSMQEMQEAMAGKSGDTSQAEKLFNRMDTDGNGEVDAAELAAAMEARLSRTRHGAGLMSAVRINSLKSLLAGLRDSSGLDIAA